MVTTYGHKRPPLVAKKGSRIDFDDQDDKTIAEENKTILNRGTGLRVISPILALLLHSQFLFALYALDDAQVYDPLTLVLGSHLDQ